MERAEILKENKAYEKGIIPRFVGLRATGNLQPNYKELKDNDCDVELNFQIYNYGYNNGEVQLSLVKEGTFEIEEISETIIIDGKEYRYYNEDIQGYLQFDNIEQKQLCVKVWKEMIPDSIVTVLPDELTRKEDGSYMILSEELHTFYKETQDIYNYNEGEFPLLVIIFRGLELNEVERDISIKIPFEVFLSQFSLTITDAFDKAEQYKAVLNRDIDQFISLHKLREYKGVTASPFIQTYSTFVITKEFDYDIYELFDSIQLSIHVPYVSFDNHFKILNNFKPPEKWVTSKNTIIYIKMYNKDKFSHAIKDENFSDIYIKYYDDNTELFDEEINKKSIEKITNKNTEVTKNEKHKFNIYFDMKFREKIREDTVIKRLAKTFSKEKNFSYDPPKVYKVKGEFYIPKLEIERTTFLYTIFNDPVLSPLFFIDERTRLIKKREQLYLYFYDSDTNYISASLKKEKATKNHVLLSDNLLVYKSTFLKVSIRKAKSIDQAVLFREVFSKAMFIYINSRKKVILRYRSILNTVDQSILDKNKDIEIDEKKDYSKIDASMKVSGYPRLGCVKNRQPVVVRKDQAGNFPNSYIIQYPKSNGKYFACDSKEFMYPGLKKNNLSNKDIYPCLPCCFKSDQRNTPKFKACMANEKVVTSNKSTEIVTDKHLAQGQVGPLPNNIRDMFLFLDPDSEFKRVGVDSSTSSILHCLLDALDPKYKKLDRDDIKGYVKSIRNSLADNLDIVSQNSYYHLDNKSYFFHTKEELARIIKSNEYLDPKIFISLLEARFKCNIYMFTRNSENPEGTICLPFFLKFYLKFRNPPDSEYKNVLIYEHMGSEGDLADYPQSELIRAKDSITENSIIVYNHRSKFIQLIKKEFDQFYSRYQNKTEFDVNIFNSKIISQGIDQFGKTQILRFDDLCALVDPLPSFPIPISDGYYPTTLDRAQAFLHEEKLEIKDRIVIDKKLVGIKTSKSGINIYIPIVPIIWTETQTTYLPSPTFLSKYSEMDKFRQLNKLSRYILDYFQYLFSIYYNNLDVKDNDIHSAIRNFVKDNVIINPEFKYGNVSRYFSLESGLLDNGKLVVPDGEVVKRLIYCIIKNLVEKKEEILDYHRRKYIEDYYLDISDFSDYPNQVILYGKNSVKEWIKSVIPSYLIKQDIVTVKDRSYYEPRKRSSKKIKVLNPKELEEKKIEKMKVEKDVTDKLLREHENTLTYFIYNDIIEKAFGGKYNVFIVQTARNLSNAIYICNYWRKYNVNIGKTIEIDKFRNAVYIITYNSYYDLYIDIFNGNNLLRTYNIEDDKAVVIVYQKEKVKYFNALLPIKK